jgi:hypothetical protein
MYVNKQLFFKTLRAGTHEFSKQLSANIFVHLVHISLPNSRVLAIERAGLSHIRWKAVSSSNPHPEVAERDQGRT